MMAYEILARCKFLTLWGQDEYGEIEWCGTGRQWDKVSEYEAEYE